MSKYKTGDGKKFQDEQSALNHCSQVFNKTGVVISIEKIPQKIRLTKQQKEALARYNYALKQEDRYLGGVFVTPIGQREIEAKTKAAFDECKRLGMTWEHGL